MLFSVNGMIFAGTHLLFGCLTTILLLAVAADAEPGMAEVFLAATIGMAAGIMFLIVNALVQDRLYELRTIAFTYMVLGAFLGAKSEDHINFLPTPEPGDIVSITVIGVSMTIVIIIYVTLFLNYQKTSRENRHRH